jgi:hypothetical protein
MEGYAEGVQGGAGPLGVLCSKAMMGNIRAKELVFW